MTLRASFNTTKNVVCIRVDVWENEANKQKSVLEDKIWESTVGWTLAGGSKVFVNGLFEAVFNVPEAGFKNVKLLLNYPAL